MRENLTFLILTTISKLGFVDCLEIIPFIVLVHGLKFFLIKVYHIVFRVALEDLIFLLFLIIALSVVTHYLYFPIYLIQFLASLCCLT